MDAAVGGASSIVSLAATTALSAAVAAARVQVDLARCSFANSNSGAAGECFREAKRALFTAEYRVVIANPSAAAADSRLAEAKAARFSAQQSTGNATRVDRKSDDLTRTLATTWLKKRLWSHWQQLKNGLPQLKLQRHRPHNGYPRSAPRSVVDVNGGAREVNFIII